MFTTSTAEKAGKAAEKAGKAAGAILAAQRAHFFLRQAHGKDDAERKINLCRVVVGKTPCQAPGSRSSGRRQPLSSDIIDPLGPRLERFRDDFHSLGVEVVMDWKYITTSDLERMWMTVIQQRVFQDRRVSIAEKKEAASMAPQETECDDLVPD